MSATVTAPYLSIVVPAYNEASRLPTTMASIGHYLRHADFAWEVRVVDDGSTDRTADVVAMTSAFEPRIVLQREKHRGKGGAVRAGMLAARGSVRLICDADLSVTIDEVAKFLARVPEHADVAIGCRECEGSIRVGEPERRHIMGRAFNKLVRRLVLPQFTDTQCGFKLYSAAAAKAVFERVTIDGWAFDVEALVIAHQLGYRIETVPVTWHYASDSRVSPVRDALLMARDVLRVRSRLPRR